MHFKFRHNFFFWRYLEIVLYLKEILYNFFKESPLYVQGPRERLTNSICANIFSGFRSKYFVKLPTRLINRF